MRKALENELAATVLLEAVYATDEAVCAKYGVSVRTLRRWRQKLITDADLAASVRTKKAVFDRSWADELPIALRRGVQLLADCAQGFSKDEAIYRRNPELISAIAGAVKICAEVYYTGKLIDDRIAKQNRPADGLPGQELSASGDGERVH